MRGKYARVCVEVAITKPLLAKLKFTEYEGIHQICFHGGVYVHRKDTCPIIYSQGPETNQDQNSLAKADSSVNVKQQPTINPEVIDNYGPWMIASKRPRRGERRKEGKEAKVQDYDSTKEISSIPKGGPFESLANLGEEA